MKYEIQHQCPQSQTDKNKVELQSVGSSPLPILASQIFDSEKNRTTGLIYYVFCHYKLS